MENIFWRGYSNDNRHAAINKIKDLVSQYGDVVDIHLFSDISINLAIEIEEIKIDSLYYELTKIIAMQEHIILSDSQQCYP